ncbi:alcohol dehydrogenase catalytic domain-containing protein [Sciscionella marina]|uniref:alcohol dehydrogenase catalytic domain-containing protein n=1 Tax=Sciscionella marina TaxID=508770 RepID=UPI000369BA6A|nr:alcohol dehydrogenase catalytic domain-containing protein [Sciscionella marina]
MKAVTWQGKRDVRVETVPDPKLVEPTDAVIRVTSSGICGSDLHLYEVMGPFIDPGDVLGHEPMGIVEEVGDSVENIKPGDRVVVPFNISCGHCLMCEQGLQSQCETTQVSEYGKGASLFGYTKLYGQVPGGQAEYLRVPQAHYGPIPVPAEAPDDRYVYLSDVLPTAWQAVQYADIPPEGIVVVFGLGPIGQFCCRVASHLGASMVIGVDLVSERLARAAAHGATILDLREHGKRIGDTVRQLIGGRGAHSVIDAVGMEAHGAPFGTLAHQLVGVLPNALAKPLMTYASVDRLTSLLAAIDSVRRGGTVSLSGVYGGQLDPLPMMELFDKQITLRMGQANVRRWIDDILALLHEPADPLGAEDFATHHLPLSEAPRAYETFQRKQDGAIKILLQPN